MAFKEQALHAFLVKQNNSFVNTYGKSKVKLSDSEIAERVASIFDMRPKVIENKLKLRNPIYLETAAYGHMGRQPHEIRRLS
jgi:S-adenosylmethionine synthetase